LIFYWAFGFLVSKKVVSEFPSGLLEENPCLVKHTAVFGSRSADPSHRLAGCIWAGLADEYSG